MAPSLKSTLCTCRYAVMSLCHVVLKHFEMHIILYNAHWTRRVVHKNIYLGGGESLDVSAPKLES
jgi:hypothetical protein